MFNLKNKTAIITGSGSGIGRATAMAFAARGASVYVTDINEEHTFEVVEEISKKGGIAKALICDVTRQQDVKEKYGTLGQLDILVNCAGISQIGTAVSTKEEDFDRIFRVNVKGICNSLHVGIPMMKKKGGAIVNMTSAANHCGVADRFGYSMTKGAVDAMTISVAKDYIAYKIRCNSVSPGRVHTPFVDGYLNKNYPGREVEMFKKLEATQPIGRMGKPEEIATLILYLCSDEASFVTGSDFPIDGGFIKLNS